MTVSPMAIPQADRTNDLFVSELLSGFMSGQLHTEHAGDVAAACAARRAAQDQAWDEMAVKRPTISL